jgi:hypothetical protein
LIEFFGHWSSHFMLPFAATFVGVAAALAMSGGAARALETDKTLSGSQRGVATLVAQPWEAFTAPFEQYIGKFNRGKFGVNNSIWTTFFPSAATEALKTANTALIPHHVAGVDGIALDCSSPFTWRSSGNEEARRAFEHTFTALLLGGDGVINITSAALINQEKISPEARNNIRRFQRHAVGLLDAVRWNTDIATSLVAASSGRNS